MTLMLCKRCSDGRSAESDELRRYEMAVESPQYPGVETVGMSDAKRRANSSPAGGFPSLGQ